MRPGGGYTEAGSYSQGFSSSSTPMNFQQMFTDLQSRLQRHEEEIRCLKQQLWLSLGLKADGNFSVEDSKSVTLQSSREA